MTSFNVDMEQTLKEFNNAVQNGLPVHRGQIHKDVIVHADQPDNIARFTYGILMNEEIIAIAAFAQMDNYQDLPCFNVGYAVKISERKKKQGTSILKLALAELKQGLKKVGIYQFYVEAGVELDNISSQKIAESVLNVSPLKGIDPDSGLPTLGYMSKQFV